MNHTTIVISQNSSFLELKSFLSQRKPYSHAVIISDTNVHPLYSASLIEHLQALKMPMITPILLKPGESSKTLDTAQQCWQKMHQAGVDRQSLVIGLGGGVITDLSGYVAACYMRGLDVIYIPTTLMGMVDASIGGKNGVNLTTGKNIVGTFHHPQLVLISPSCLKTLPEREVRAGLAEVVKYGIIKDPDLFERLEKEAAGSLLEDSTMLEEVIRRCSNIKMNIVREDEKEKKGLRVILNLGHTFAHALEAATHYNVYSHGEAVSVGLISAFYTSHCLGLINQALIMRLHRILSQLKLPITLPDQLSAETLIHHMSGDKKTIDGKINLILVEKIGQVKQYFDVNPQLILKALKKQKSLE